MQINTSYNEVVLALDNSAEAKKYAASADGKEQMRKAQPDRYSIVSFNSSAPVSSNSNDFAKINNLEEAKEDLKKLSAQENIDRNILTMKILAQANASAEKYLQLLMQSMMA